MLSSLRRQLSVRCRKTCLPENCTCLFNDKKKTSSTYSSTWYYIAVVAYSVSINSRSSAYPDSSTSSPRKQTAWTPDECPRRTVTGNGGGRILSAIARLVVVARHAAGLHVLWCGYNIGPYPLPPQNTKLAPSQLEFQDSEI